MEPLVRYAIPGVVIAAGLGAVILCFLALRVFNRDGQESEHYSQSRLFFMRMGHALAACCFAIAAVLASVAFRSPAVPPTPPPDTSLAGRVSQLATENDRLAEELRILRGQVLEQLRAASPAASPPSAT